MASNFGRSMLEKYGWTHGKGLGREEDGTVNPIVVCGNFNGYGLQHDVAEEFKNQWWDHVYNKATSNLSVSTSQDGDVKVDRKGEFELSQKAVSFVKSNYYSSFVKEGTSSELPEEKDTSMTLSYDELFKICGGKTVHKGARHGIKMTAKLERVKQQEQELLDRWRSSKENKVSEEEKKFSSSNGNQHVGKPDRVDIEETQVKPKKKKRSKKDLEDTYDVAPSFHSDEVALVDSDISKKHRKDKKGLELVESDVICSDQGLNCKSSKKDRKLLELNFTSDAYEQIDPLQERKDDGIEVGKSKRKRKEKKLCQLMDTLENDLRADPTQEANSDVSLAWKKSKKEKKLLKSKNDTAKPLEERIDEGTVRKSKKKKSVDLEKETEVEVFVTTQELGKEHKRKKKKKSSDVEKESENEVTVTNDLEVENIVTKHKKKKRSKGKEDSDVEKESENEVTVTNDLEVENIVTKHKKKKRSKDKEDRIGIVAVIETSEVENTVHKHKKKKKSKGTEKENDFEAVVETERFEVVHTSNKKSKKKKRDRTETLSNENGVL